jgi:hypothetical protein
MNLSTAYSNLSFGPNGFLYAGGGGSGAPIYKIDTLNGQAQTFSGSNSSGDFVIASNQRLYAINQSGGISGYSTITGSQVFGASGLNLNPAYGNLSFGPDGYLYADGGGSGAPIFKINTLNSQISVFSGSYSSGEFVFGSDNTLYTINSFGGVVGYNTATRQQVFNTGNLLGLDPRYGNLSFGPDGYLYANGGGFGGQIFKINTSNGEVTWFDESSFSSGQFVFATSVPEVDTWGMLLVGLGLVGVAARRRKLAII